MKSKVCKICGVEKPLTEFYLAGQNRDGHHKTCIECYKKKRKEYYRKKTLLKPPSKTILKSHPKWTVSAIDCLQRGCVCKGCFINEMKIRCYMKKTILDLMKKYGRPIEYKEPTILKEN